MTNLPARVHTFDIEGQPVRCIETDDGKRTWLCDCESFKAREKRLGDIRGGCGHVAVAIMKWLDESDADSSTSSAPPTT